MLTYNKNDRPSFDKLLADFLKQSVEIEKDLAAKYGYEAIVQPITIKGKHLYRVSIPCQFDTKREFQQIFKRLQLQFEEVEVIKK